MRLFLVEDEVMALRSLQRKIEDLKGDWEIVGTASNGTEALPAILLTNPQIVLTDICMPDMDGITLIAQLQECGAHAIPIIVSGYSEFDYAQQAMRLGVQDYLLKPVDPAELSKSLEQCASTLLRKRRKGNVISVCAGENQLFLELEPNETGYVVAYLFIANALSEHTHAQHPRIPASHGITEIDAINRSFETMFRHLKASIAQSIQSHANEERANYLALQAQMNPHTLYNTIGMIESVSYMNGDLEVSNLCISFSHMLRYISDYTKRIYTVQDELQHLEDYATLTMKRYEGRLTISSSCAEDLTRRELPKLTIQPLVENAVKHGFGADCTHLSVDVSVSLIPSGWQIQVADSGQGFAPDRIEELEKQFLRCDRSLAPGNDVVNQKIGNLALSNIYIRCRIQFGNAFRIRLRNNSDGPGCFVTLLFLTDEEKQH